MDAADFKWRIETSYCCPSSDTFIHKKFITLCKSEMKWGKSCSHMRKAQQKFANSRHFHLNFTRLPVTFPHEVRLSWCENTAGNIQKNSVVQRVGWQQWQHHVKCWKTGEKNRTKNCPHRVARLLHHLSCCEHHTVTDSDVESWKLWENTNMGGAECLKTVGFRERGFSQAVLGLSQTKQTFRPTFWSQIIQISQLS